MDIIKYTDDEIEKNLALLENHLKQSPAGDEIFCEECINKHLILLEGLAEEGMTAGGDSEKYQRVNDFVTKIKGQDYQKKGIELANKSRQLRKSLSICPTCTLAKDLNNPLNYNDYTHNSRHISGDTQLNGNTKEMAKVSFKDLGMYNVGQFAGEGVKYLIETKLAAQEPYASLGGGVVLQVLPMVVKLPPFLQKLFLVAGSNVLASGVIKLVKGVTAPVPTVRAGALRANVTSGNPVGKYTGRPNGRVFGGQVTASNIPTQYARAGILSGAQAFESPEHADLIRVD